MGSNSKYRYLALKDQDDYSYGRSGKDAYQTHRRDKKWMKILTTGVFVALFILLLLYTSFMKQIFQSISRKLGNEVYAVIIDAGSTGSRVLAYTFYKTDDELILEDELFHEMKPGLSSFVDDPEKGAESIVKLVEFAYNVVPSKRRSVSPLIVRATAGLRMLDPDAASRLLEAVRDAIKTTGFLVGQDSVEIMEGEAEGINSWFTVNFLQERLKGQTAAALDLGGGSTQVTYQPTAEAPSPLVGVPGPNGNITLFTHSYSNLGLMAVRHGVLMEENKDDTAHVESKCVNSVVKDQRWRYKNKDYFVSGSQKDIKYLESKESILSISSRSPVVNLEQCKTLIYNVVRRHLAGAPVPTHIGDHHINAFSYFTDAATDAGLVDPISGGKLKVSDYIEASELECSTVNVDQPWICLDLTYMAILLQEAYKLPPHKEIELVKKINGHEVSWALGLAYNTLSTSIQ